MAPNPNATHLIDSGAPHSAVARRRGAAFCAAALGLVLLYASGFAQVGYLHNGAHDARHSANLPCH